MRVAIAPLVKGMLIYGMGDVLSKLMGFLLLPLFTAYLAPSDYGVSSILTLATSVLMVIFALGFGASFAVVYSKSGGSLDYKAATVWTSTAILAISVTILGVIGIAFAPQIANALFQTPVAPYFIQLSFVTDAFTILSIPVSIYYQMEQRATAYVAISLTGALLSIILNILMVAVLHLGVMGWLQAGLISQGVLLLLYVLPALTRLPFRLRAVIGADLLRLGLPVVPAFAFIFVMQQSNLFFLERFSGLAAAGIYTVGTNLGGAINIVVNAFTRAWTPYFLSYRERWDEAKILFGRITTYYLVIIGGLSLCFFMFARSVILIMTKPAFHQAYSVVGIVATTQVLTGLFSVLLPAIYFAGAFRSIPIIQAGAAAVTVTVCVLAIPPFGATGAALATALGTGAMCLFTNMWNRAHKDYFQVNYESGRLRKFAALYAVIALVSLIPREFPLSLELACACLGLLALVIAVYRLMLDTEKTAVGSLIRRAGALIQIRSAS